MTGRPRLLAAVALLGAAGVCRADAGMDRKTCLAAMASYPKIHEALITGQPKERVTAILVAEGQRAGVDKALLVVNAARWVEMLRDVPQELLPAPEWVREQSNGFCGRYPR